MRGGYGALESGPFAVPAHHPKTAYGFPVAALARRLNAHGAVPNIRGHGIPVREAMRCNLLWTSAARAAEAEAYPANPCREAIAASAATAHVTPEVCAGKEERGCTRSPPSIRGQGRGAPGWYWLGFKAWGCW